MPEQNVTSSGHIRLVWDKEGRKENESYILEKSENDNFENPEVVYQGPDQASFVSGLPNGTYYFRVKQYTEENQIEKAPWSQTVRVDVRHHSLAMALSLAGVGLLVFGLTVVVVIKGAYSKE